MKLATWNINSLPLRWPQVKNWLDETQTDILAVQETKVSNDKFPVAAVKEAGYAVDFFGQKAYNGVAFIFNPEQVSLVGEAQYNLPDFEDDQARLIAATWQLKNAAQVLRTACVYVPNGQSVGSEKFSYKMRWLEVLCGWVKAELEQHPHFLVMGDFNIAPDDRDVWDAQLFAGQLHCSEEERSHLRALQSLGLVDAFRLFNTESGHYSWWDYRQMAFRRKQGLRIDLIYLSQALAKRATGCSIDKTPRGQERPSDHAPVVLCLNAENAQ